MGQEGINTEVFTAHSLRGATATWLLKKGTPRNLVQARGGWADTRTMDDYYNRLHQSQSWEAMLQGENAGSRQSVDCAVSLTTVSRPKPTEEGERRETEYGNTAQATELSALGIARPLYDLTQCMVCQRRMLQEAAYRCSACRRLCHVRCLAKTAHDHTHHLRSCLLCHPRGFQTTAVGAANPEELIEDVMGVCSPPSR